MLAALLMTALNARRSFHPDEAATLLFGELRLHPQFRHREAQHGLFYDAMIRWCDAVGSGPAVARLPTTALWGAGLAMTVAIGLRLAGIGGAVAMGALFLSSRFAVQGGTEIRFYGPLLALGAGSTLLLLRLVERPRAPEVAGLAILGWLAWRIHPAAAPWHGAALLAGAVLLALAVWRRGAREGDPAAKSPAWWAAVIVLLLGLYGALAIAPQILAQARHFRFAGNVGETGAAEWTPMLALLRQGSWFFPERAGILVPVATLLWLGLAVAGTRVAWRRSPALALVLAAPLLLHAALAFIVGTPRSLAIKYLASSFPALLALTVLGGRALHEALEARWRHAGAAALGVLAIGGGALAWPGAAMVAFGDGAHYFALRAALPERDPRGRPPMVIAPPFLRGIAELHTERLGTAPITWVDARMVPLWRARGLIAQGAWLLTVGRVSPEAPEGITLRPIASATSSFTPDWSWTLFEARLIDEDISSDQGRTIIPAWRADHAPLDTVNGPARIAVPGEASPRLGIQLVTNEAVIYDLVVPTDAVTFFVETLFDEPGPPVWEIRADGRILGVPVAAPPRPGIMRLRVPVPADLRGKTARWSLHFLAGNSAQRPNDAETNAGLLLSVGFEDSLLPSDGQELIRPSLLLRPPDILRDPMEALRGGLLDAVIAPEPLPLRLVEQEGELVLAIPADEATPDGPLVLPAIAARPGTIVYAECELRAVGVGDHQITGLLGAVPAGGGALRNRLFSAEPVGPGTTPWRRQVIVAGVPAGHEGVALGWYITRGSNPVPKRGHFEVRRLRLVDAEALRKAGPFERGPLPAF